MIRIAMADDHALIRQSLANMINSFGDYRVIWQAANGKEVIEMLALESPEILLLDIRMPDMDGFETCKWMTKNRPDVKVLALSMMDDESAVIKMIRSGAKGYMLKDSEPSELREALHALVEKGIYFNEMVTGKLLHAIIQDDVTDDGQDPVHITPKEIEFLRLCATEHTYKEIADRMDLSPRTIDGYRESLFEKLGLKSRVGLAMFAMRKGYLGTY